MQSSIFWEYDWSEYWVAPRQHRLSKQMNTATAEQKQADPMHPVTDPILRKLNLSKEEIADIEQFMHAITATQYKMRRPEELPR